MGVIYPVFLALKPGGFRKGFTVNYSYLCSTSLCFNILYPLLIYFLFRLLDSLLFREGTVGGNLSLPSGNRKLPPA